jgi:hypothetical protein
MNLELKQLHNETQSDDSLPPLDDNDEFFEVATAEQRTHYIYETLKKALRIFLKNKELAKYQTEKILDLEARVKRLEKIINKNIGI